MCNDLLFGKLKMPAVIFLRLVLRACVYMLDNVLMFLDVFIKTPLILKRAGTELLDHDMDPFIGYGQKAVAA